MGSRPSKVSPTILGLRSRIIQEDSSLLTVPHAKKSSTSLLASRHSVHFSGNLENSANGYLTPRPRGRSALYRTSRSPYFKVHPTTSVRVCANDYGTENLLYLFFKKLMGKACYYLYIASECFQSLMCYDFRLADLSGMVYFRQYHCFPMANK